MAKRDLEGCLAPVFLSYARHFFAVAPELPAFTAQLEGPFVRLVVRAPDGPQVVRRRASAYLLLAGHFWGASRGAEHRRELPALLASLTSYPHGDANGWANARSFERDFAARAALVALAEELRAEEPDEASLLLQRLFGTDAGWVAAGPVEPVESPRIAALAASNASRGIAGRRGPDAPRAFARTLIRDAASTDVRHRLSAAAELSSLVHTLADDTDPTFVPVAEAMLDCWLDERDGAVFEVALGVAQELGAKLLYGGAYEPANRLLDRVIPHHVAPTETLRQRWECRTYAGDPRAEEDLRRAATLDSPGDPAYLGRCLFWTGDVADRRSMARSRVATALVAEANGIRPLHGSAVETGTPPVDALCPRADLLSRARALSDEAVQEIADRVAETLKTARAQGSAPGRGFQAEVHASKARVHEAAGELPEALASYRMARRLRIAGGIPWQSDDFGADVRRVSLGSSAVAAGRVPVSFDPAWLIREDRTEEERALAIDRWTAQRWRGLPSRTALASDSAIAAVLLRAVVDQGRDLWRDGQRMRIGLGDRVAFSERAFAWLDPWVDRRDTRCLAALLPSPLAIAFPAASNATHLAAQRGTLRLLRWVEELTRASAIDGEAVLRGLRGQPWSALRIALDARVAEQDPLRDLFDEAAAVGFDGAEIACIVRAYAPLFERDGSERATPGARWMKIAAPLRALDSSRLARCLLDWTRARLTAGDGSTGKTIAAQWLWPLRFVTDVSAVQAFLDELRDEDERTDAPHAECLAWLQAGFPVERRGRRSLGHEGAVGAAPMTLPRAAGRLRASR